MCFNVVLSWPSLVLPDPYKSRPHVDHASHTYGPTIFTLRIMTTYLHVLQIGNNKVGPTP